MCFVKSTGVGKDKIGFFRIPNNSPSVFLKVVPVRFAVKKIVNAAI